MVMALLIGSALVLAVVLTLLFGQRQEQPKPERGVLDAFHMLLLGERVPARKLLAELVRSGNAPIEAYLQLGAILREDGEPARALALHQGVLARQELLPDLRRLAELGVAEDLLALDRVEEAQRRLEALDASLVDESVLALHARALHRLGRVDDAAQVLRRRSRICPQGPADASRYLAEIAREALAKHEHDVARRRAREARQFDPTQPWAYAVEGDVKLAEGKPAEALEIWRTGLANTRAGRGTLLTRVVDVAFRSGQLERIVEELESLRAEHPEDPELWGAVADLRLRRGDRETFLLLVEDPPAGVTHTLERSVGWLRVLLAQNDEKAVQRVFRALPDSFGPRRWRCPACNHAEDEPRAACMRCGRLVASVPSPEKGRRRQRMVLAQDEA